MTSIQSSAARSIQFKFVDSDQRIIEGTCSSDSLDKQGDVLEMDGASWNVPMPLLSDHSWSLRIGTVTSIWRAGNKLKFRAVVDSGDAWDRILARKKTGVSIGFDPIAQEPLENNRYRFTSFVIREISWVNTPANSDAKVHRVERHQFEEIKSARGRGKHTVVYYDKARSSPQSEKPQLSQKAMELNRISTRIKEIDKAIKTFARQEDLHYQDQPRVEAIHKAREVISAERVALLEREALIVAGVVDPEHEARAAETDQGKGADAHDGWDIRDIPEPIVPADFMPQEAREKYLDAILGYHIDQMTKQLSDDGEVASAFVHMDELAVIAGMVKGFAVYSAQRSNFLEARIAELENSAMKYMGTYQRAMDYSKRSSVTHRGALWTALKDVDAGEVPGESSGWQLSVKSA